MSVSIHAPVWGAKRDYSKSGNQPSFNPRTRVGCEYSQIEPRLRQNSFNPRTRVGCEQRRYDKLAGDLVSIHAPVWGAKKNMG